MEKTQSPVKVQLKRKRQSKASTSERQSVVINPSAKPPKKISSTPAKPKESPEDLAELQNKFPILRNEELVKKFLAVPMTNNQKGRIRQLLKANLQGVSEILLPSVIYNQIQSILKTSPSLTDAELRKLRILYNMLKTAINNESSSDRRKEPNPESKVSKISKISKLLDQGKGDVKVKVKKETAEDKKEKEGKGQKDKEVVKVKGPKRYIVFLGNLPLDITKEAILGHFSEMSEHIKDVRIPKQQDGKKSKFAYVELANEPSFEFALSKNHSMLGRKRINVSYTKHQKSKITLAEAKAKAAKLSALQRSGKLLGSIPLDKKRSQRRKKLKEARAKEAAALG